MQIISNFYGNEKPAKSFFELQKRIFPSIDIAKAFEDGFISPDVVPFGIFKDGEALSILNATTMDIIIGDTVQKALQLGTVATHPEFLNQGLSKKLIDHVLNYYMSSRRLFFLFANDEVLDFYPKFGFSKCSEHLFRFELNPKGDRTFKKLDPANNPSDDEIVRQSFAGRTPVSTCFGIRDYSLLATWYCLEFFKDDLWYSHATKTLMVGYMKDECFQIQDVVSERIDPDFFNRLKIQGVKSVVIHFVPDRFEGIFNPEPDTANMLFTRGKPDKEPTYVKIPPLAHT